MASLDGLRALAVLAVMAVHAGVPGAAAGWLGVDLFFVLSGFLITTLIAAEYTRNGRVSLAKFWGRRLLRLMPAYWVYVASLTAAMTSFGWGWTHDHGDWTVEGYIASLWLYFVNYAPKGAMWEHQSLALHLWSLAVEEQFYLIWPALSVALLRSGRPAAVTWLLATVVLWWRSVAAADDDRLDTRGFGIVVGCAVALSLRDESATARRLLGAAWLRTCVLVVMGAIVLVATFTLGRGTDEADVHRWAVPAATVVFAVFVAMLWYGEPDRLSRALAWWPLASLGTISYGMYLYHMLSQYLTWHVLTPGIENWPRWPKFGLRLVIYGCLTVAMAAASYRLIESRFLRLKSRLH